MVYYSFVQTWFSTHDYTTYPQEDGIVDHNPLISTFDSVTVNIVLYVQLGTLELIEKTLGSETQNMRID